MKRKLRVITILFFIVLMMACTTELKPETQILVETITPPDYQWVQIGENGAVYIRAIFKTIGQKCPAVETVDTGGTKASLPMQPRAQTMPQEFDITVCEAALTAPEKVKTATLGGKNLVLPTKSPQRIVVVGDTGCRIKGKSQQNCNNNPNVSPEKAEPWLFTKTVESAMKLKPDLIIHVGDFLYRESECTHPDRCGGSPYGPKWATWEADFFKPAASLLESVPWVFARGNHESCQREWRGWYLFLDPRALGGGGWTACSADQERSAPFEVALAGLDLLVMDTADEAQLADYQTTLAKHTGTAPAWLVTHRPLWGIAEDFTATPPDGVIPALQQANVKFHVAGHMHLFEMIQFDKGISPPQMIAGGGATELDPPVDSARFAGEIKTIGAIAANSEVLDKFTFVVVVIKNDGWHITVMDEDGTTEKQSFVISNS